MKDFDHKRTVPVDWVIGSFMLTKKETVEKIGFFDDRFFMYFEDCDWCRRIWEGGWKVYYVHDIMAKHSHHRDSAEVSLFKSLLNNPIVRIHLRSWWRYFRKWGWKKVRYGQ